MISFTLFGSLFQITSKVLQFCKFQWLYQKKMIQSLELSLWYVLCGATTIFAHASCLCPLEEIKKIAVGGIWHTQLAWGNIVTAPHKT